MLELIDWKIVLILRFIFTWGVGLVLQVTPLLQTYLTYVFTFPTWTPIVTFYIRLAPPSPFGVGFPPPSEKSWINLYNLIYSVLIYRTHRSVCEGRRLCGRFSLSVRQTAMRWRRGGPDPPRGSWSVTTGVYSGWKPQSARRWEPPPPRRSVSTHSSHRL